MYREVVRTAARDGVVGTQESAAAPEVAVLLDRLEVDTPGIVDRAVQLLLADVPDYAAITSRDFREEVLQHATEHVAAFIRVARSGRLPSEDDLHFVRDRAVQRAREHVPLEALLQTYRIGQRAAWEAIVEEAGHSRSGLEAALALTATTFGYTNAISAIAAEAYLQEQQRALADTELAKRDLLGTLLGGAVPDERRLERLLHLGIRAESMIAVVVVVGEDTASLEASAQRVLAHAVSRSVFPDLTTAFVVPRYDEVVALVPIYGERTPLGIRDALAPVADQLLKRDISTLTGISRVCTRLEEVARGYREARQALRHASADQRAVAIDEVGLFEYLTAAADSLADDIVSPAARRLVEEDTKRGNGLIATLFAYADSSLNIQKTSKMLFVHPNTVQYRLRRIREITGRDPRQFRELLELIAAATILGRADPRTNESLRPASQTSA